MLPALGASCRVSGAQAICLTNPRRYLSHIKPCGWTLKRSLKSQVEWAFPALSGLVLRRIKQHFFWGETSEVLPHQHMVFPQVWQVCLQISTGHPPHPAARPSPMLVCYPWGNPLWMCRCERTNERNRTEPTLVQTQVGHSRTRHRSGCLFIAPKSRDLGCP